MQVPCWLDMLARCHAGGSHAGDAGVSGVWDSPEREVREGVGRTAAAPPPALLAPYTEGKEYVVAVVVVGR